MPNGKYVLQDMDFDEKIKEMNDRELLEFTARLGYSNTIRITTLENRDKKSMGFIGGASGLLGGIIVFVLDYFVRR